MEKIHFRGPIAVNRITAPRLARGALALLRDANWLTGERLLVCGTVFAAMSTILLIFAVVFYTANGLTSAGGNQLAWDFIVHFAAAKAAVSGHASLVYDQAWFQGLENRITGPAQFRLYPYPPVAMLLSLPLALFSFIPALIVWTLSGGMLCFEPLRRLVGWRRAALAVIGTPAAFFNLLGGQNGAFTAALFAGGVMTLDRRPIVAGLCFGCLVYKPQLALLLPFALVAGGRWRTVAAAAVTVAVLVLASIALFGTAAWLEFPRGILNQIHMLERDGPSYWHRIPTVFFALRHLGASSVVCYAGQMISGALALACVARLWRSRATLEIKAAALAIATFLATPQAWDYDMMMLIFAAAWLGREGMRTGFLAWERLAVVALLTLPLITIVVSVRVGIQPGPVVLWLLLLLLLRRALGSERIPAVTGIT